MGTDDYLQSLRDRELLARVEAVLGTLGLQGGNKAKIKKHLNVMKAEG